MINPLNIATRGFTASSFKSLSIATDGYLSLAGGGFPFTGGGGPGDERLDRLKREDDEILFIIKEFIKWVS